MSDIQLPRTQDHDHAGDLRPHAGHSHRHEQAHVHDHGHHHSHDHSHSHDVSAGLSIAARPAAPAFSLLTLSVWERLFGAAILSVILWLGVWWALT